MADGGVCLCVAGELVNGFGGEDVDGDAAVVQVPCDDVAIAAVVSATAYDEGGGERFVLLFHVVLDEFGGVSAGVFHEDDAGDAQLVDGAFVDLPGLFAGEIVHG